MSTSLLYSQSPQQGLAHRESSIYSCWMNGCIPVMVSFWGVHLLSLTSIPSLALHLVWGLPRPHSHATATLQSCSLSRSDWFKFSSRGIWLVTDHPRDWRALDHLSISCMSRNLAQMPRLYEFTGNCWVLATLPMRTVSLTRTRCHTRHHLPASPGFPQWPTVNKTCPFTYLFGTPHHVHSYTDSINYYTNYYYTNNYWGSTIC